MSFRLSGEACVANTILPAHMSGFDGLAHGGIVALLLDEVAQWTLVGRLGRLGLTQEATVRFLKPVPTGQELALSGRIVGLDDRQARIRATIHSARGVLLADGESKWALRSLEKIAEITGMNEETLRAFLAHYHP